MLTRRLFFFTGSSVRSGLVTWSQTELAKRTGREVSAISQAARRVEIAAKERKFLEQTIGLLLTNLQMSNMTR